MQIVKEGDPKKALLPKTCNGHGNSERGCGTEVLLSGPDVSEWHISRSDGCDYYRTWVCPICYHWNDLDIKDKVTGITRKGRPPVADGVRWT